MEKHPGLTGIKLLMECSLETLYWVLIKRVLSQNCSLENERLFSVSEVSLEEWKRTSKNVRGPKQRIKSHGWKTRVSALSCCFRKNLNCVRDIRMLRRGLKLWILPLALQDEIQNNPRKTKK